VKDGKKASWRVKSSRPPKPPKETKRPKASSQVNVPTGATAKEDAQPPAGARPARSLTSMRPMSTIRSIRVRSRSKATRASKPTSGKGSTRGSRSPRVLVASLRASARRPSAKTPSPKTPSPEAGAADKTAQRTDGPKRVTRTKTKTEKQPTSPLTRRNRIPVAVAAVFALVVLAAAFPAATLISQHRQQAADAADLRQLQHSNQQLAEQRRALESKTEIGRLARQEYQLVPVGRVLYEVLPPSGSRTATTVSGGTESGDPGQQPLVSPSHAPDMSPDPGLPQAVVQTAGGSSNKSNSDSSHGTGASQKPSSYWGRVANTLEFWQ
jgi:cell division protein FtsB